VPEQDRHHELQIGPWQTQLQDQVGR
jgi:hypothetical protein